MTGTSEPIGVEAPLAELRVELAALDAVSEWRRCGMTADFAARYFACASSNPVTAASVLATVINELVENAVKFSADKRASVTLVVRHRGDVLEIETTNDAAESELVSLERAVFTVMTSDPEALFGGVVGGTVATASAGENARSGLGLIVLRKDYGAAIDVAVDRRDGGNPRVTVRVILDIEELEQR